MNNIASHLLCAALLLMSGTELAAGTITAFGSTSIPSGSTGSIGPVGLTPAPNNDNISVASSNAISYNIFFNSFGTLDVEYVVSDSGGTTEYTVTQSLLNNSGQTWTGFQFVLGFGLGTNFAPVSSLGSLDFDTPDGDPAPVSSRFSSLDHQPTTLIWSGAVVPLFGTTTFSFAIDVPDGVSGLNPNGFNRFTLRQFPIAPTPVPEPGTLALLGAGLAGIGLKLRNGAARVSKRKLLTTNRCGGRPADPRASGSKVA
ncbi:MAG TPA: PEP-CTERM sorting domain-containing protein [Bryobacteraceae bacterium]|nr:PEP-CTERM sorting domain-containing protein [Bryobacteraceae bacterium]